VAQTKVKGNVSLFFNFTTVSGCAWQESFCEEDADLLASMGYNSIRLGTTQEYLD
jgi:hypothetical protein